MHYALIDKISSRLPFGALNFLSGPKVLPLFYHAVGISGEMPYLEGLYTLISPEVFEKELDFVLKKYKPIDLEGVVNYSTSGVLPGKNNCFFLSFDDGLRQCKEIVAPILERKGIPATFFINSGFVDNTAFLHRFIAVMLSKALKKDKSEALKTSLEEYLGIQFTCRYKAAKYIMTLRYPHSEQLKKIGDHLGLDIEDQLMAQKPYMSKEDIKDLIAKGFTIGAHSVDHPEYYLLSEEEQLKQTITSLHSIDEWFHPKHRVFAFPFTDVGVKTSFFETLEKEFKPDLTFGSSGLKKDKIANHIHRIPMDDCNLTAENRLKSEFLYYLLKQTVGKNIYKRN